MLVSGLDGISFSSYQVALSPGIVEKFVATGMPSNGGSLYTCALKNLKQNKSFGKYMWVPETSQKTSSHMISVQDVQATLIIMRRNQVICFLMLSPGSLLDGTGARRWLESSYLELLVCVLRHGASPGGLSGMRTSAEQQWCCSAASAYMLSQPHSAGRNLPGM